MFNLLCNIMKLVRRKMITIKSCNFCFQSTGQNLASQILEDALNQDQNQGYYFHLYEKRTFWTQLLLFSPFFVPLPSSDRKGRENGNNKMRKKMKP